MSFINSDYISIDDIDDDRCLTFFSLCVFFQMLIYLFYSYSIVDTICPKEAFFYARLSATRTLNTYSVIKFDKIMINNGNHYHPADGVFVAPISGVYMFAWNTLTFNSKGLYTELRVENEVKGTVASNAASGFYTPGSTSLLCHVKKGEHVWVQTSSGTSTNYLHDWKDSTSFMGFLLQKD
jgi:hypothetical protein